MEPPNAHRIPPARRGVTMIAAAAVLAIVVSGTTIAMASASPTRTEAAKPAKKPKKKPAKKVQRPPALPKSCIELGLYRDNPVGTYASIQKTFGAGVTTVATYVTTGRALDPKLAALAKKRGLRLLVSWMPDGGKEGPNQPKFRLKAITSGKLDADLKALALEMKQAGVPVIFRPMPEPNTPWYAWSGTVNGNTPEQYAAAWKRVRKVVKKFGGKRVSLLWSPYVRSVPDDDPNAIAKYFPGAAAVDLVGVSGYNFGTTGDLTWTDPRPLFITAYSQIQALAPKPFWISETGSTATGGDKNAWIASLKALKTDMPMLRGVVWFDVNEPNGDFRLTGASAAAAKSLIKGRCIA